MVKNADLSYDGLKKIKLIDACIKETRRLFTFIALLREADHDCEVAGVKVSFLTLMTHKRMKLRLKREILSCSCLLEFIKVENSMKSQKNSILIVLMEMNRTLSKVDNL